MLVDVTADDSRALERSPLLGLRTSSTCIDEVIGRYKATCPTGATSKYWTEGFDSGKRPAIRIRFATGTCAPCAVRDQCTSSHRYGRQLTVRPQEQNVLLERVRAEQATEEWKQRYATRAGVEGTIHQAVAVTGARRSRYTSLAKTHLAHIFTAAAVNLIRLDAWWNGTPLAPTRISYVAGLGGFRRS